MTNSEFRHTWRTHVGGTVAVCLLAGLVNYLLRGEPTSGLLPAVLVHDRRADLGLDPGCCPPAWASLMQALAADDSPALEPGPGPGLGAGCRLASWSARAPARLCGGGARPTNHVTGMREPQPWEHARRPRAATVGRLRAADVAAGDGCSSIHAWAASTGQAPGAGPGPAARPPRPELALLQDQLEPAHMLFNTLAHLRVLIEAAARTRPSAMLDRLIHDYLRATLQASRATEHRARRRASPAWPTTSPLMQLRMVRAPARAAGSAGRTERRRRFRRCCCSRRWRTPSSTAWSPMSRAASCA